MILKKLLPLLALAGVAFAASAVNYEQAIAPILPRLADPVVGSRYAAELELQAITSDAAKPGHESDRAACGAALAAKAADSSVPQPARVWIVRQLQYMGGAEAVDALTQLLGDADPELRECARRALEQNSAPAATASLRTALAKGGDAAWIIGLMNSLALRGAADAVPEISRHLADPATAAAAAQALGRIGSPAAVDALWLQFASVPAAGDALIDAANHLAATGDRAAASRVFQKLYQPGQSSSLRVAALRGAVKSDPAGASQIVADALRSADQRLQEAALSAATGQPALTAEVGRLLPELSAPAKAKALGVVDTAAVPAVIALTKDADAEVRLAAIQALGRLGTRAGVTALLPIAANGQSADKAAAETALGSVTGDEALAALEQATGPSAAVPEQAAALNALAAHQQKSALPRLLAAAKSTDPLLRKAGLNGLRQMGGDAEIEAVGQMVVTSKGEDVSAVLSAMAERVTDKPAAAAKLLALAGNDQAALAALAGALAQLGGDSSLAALVKLSASRDADTRSSAIEALGNWPGMAAAQPLLTLAGDPQAGAAAQAALAGVVNLVKNNEDAPLPARLDAALAALKLAKRPADTKLALSALAAVPDARSAAAVKPLLTDDGVKREAGAAALTIATALVRTDRAAGRALAQAVKQANLSPDFNQRADKIR